MADNKMFILNTIILTNEASCFNANDDEASDLWYIALKHLSYKNFSLIYLEILFIEC